LDLILYGLERFVSPEEISNELAVEKVLVDKVKSKWLANEHKRRMPLAPKIGYRTVGNDFRLPRHTY
jgi:NH3-dependent NAD+ synthetase